MRGAVILALALAACAPRPATRADFTRECVFRGADPIRCAEAAERVIPAERKS